MAQERSAHYDEQIPTGDLGQAYALEHSVLLPFHREAARQRQSSVYKGIKRAFDVVSSACLFLIVWPLFFLIALAIKIDSKGPIIYRHKRVGMLGKSIYLYKFRSMVADADAMIKQFTPEQRSRFDANFKLDDDPRITRIGRLLRKSSLDELPQLLNILKGELSVVGPRPVVEAELIKYGENADKFLSVKPGLTGYWQAYARSDCDYDTRMEMELKYAREANLWWDIRILFATVVAVFCGKGAQ